MLLYLTLGTDDLDRAVAFWGPILHDLGHARLAHVDAGWAGWGHDYDDGFGFYLCPPFDGRTASAGNGETYAFAARNAAHVRALHALALQNGGTDDGGPGTRTRY